MKNTIINVKMILVLAICILMLPGTYVYSQPGKSKAKAPKDTTQVIKGGEREMTKGKQKSKDVSKKERDLGVEIDESKAKDSTGRGHAYGRNKGDLSGREFGQQRAEDAKLNKEQKEKELDSSITEGEQKVKEAKEKIEKSKQQLEKDKSEKKITDTEYKEKKEKIEKAEKAV